LSYTEYDISGNHKSPILMDIKHSFTRLILQIDIKMERPVFVICNLCATHAENIGRPS
jgi:hypothetical protein